MAKLPDNLQIIEVIKYLMAAGTHATYCEISQSPLASFCTCDWDEAEIAAYVLLAEMEGSI